MGAECGVEESFNVFEQTETLYCTRRVLHLLNFYSVILLCRAKQRLHAAALMFLEVVLKRDFPAFITTYLSEEHTFASAHQRPLVEVLDKSKL